MAITFRGLSKFPAQIVGGDGIDVETSGNSVVISTNVGASALPTFTGDVTNVDGGDVLTIGASRVTSGMIQSGAVDLSSKVSGALAVAHGGTGAVAAPAALSVLGALPLAGGSMSGDLILANTTPPTNLSAAPKQYVDALAAGLAVKQSVVAATTANGSLTTAFANSSTVDGVSLATGNRLLIKNQSAPAENGIYTVAASGEPTRVTDLDTWSEAIGAFTFVTGGSANIGTGWVAQATSTGTIGSSSLPWAQYSANTAYTADESSLHLAGTVFSIPTGGVTNAKIATATVAASRLVGSDIATVGTIGTGVWHGTAVGTQWGGTGQDFSASTGVPLYTSGTTTVLMGTTGTGSVVRAASPTVTGTLTAATANFSGPLTISGSTSVTYPAVNPVAALQIVNTYASAQGVGSQLQFGQTAGNPVAVVASYLNDGTPPGFSSLKFAVRDNATGTLADVLEVSGNQNVGNPLAISSIGGNYNFGAVNNKGFQAFVGHTSSAPVTSSTPGDSTVIAGYFMADNDNPTIFAPTWGSYSEGRAGNQGFTVGAEIDVQNTSGIIARNIDPNQMFGNSNVDAAHAPFAVGIWSQPDGSKYVPTTLSSAWAGIISAAFYPGTDNQFIKGIVFDQEVIATVNGHKEVINFGADQEIAWYGTALNPNGTTTNIGRLSSDGSVLSWNGDVKIATGLAIAATPGTAPGLGNTTTGLTANSIQAFISSPGGGSGGALYLNQNTDGAIQGFSRSGTTVGSISVTTTNTAYNLSSDERLKEDLQPFDAGRIIDATNVYDFKWKATGERSYGVMAQQANEIYPHAVTYDEKQDWWGVDYSKYVPVLLQELKALRARVAHLEGAQ